MIDLPAPALIGVIHLPPLPGSPAHTLPMNEIINRAVADATTIHNAGFDAAVVENFGDAPFPRDALPPSSLAAIAVAADHVRRKTGLTVGINALRNDARGALGIAVAVGASFIRVNVHTGACATDQGIIEGHADQTLRDRKQLGARVAVFADVNVKHAVPLVPTDLARVAKDTAYRGMADALIVTGAATGEPADLDHLRKVKQAVPDRWVLVGSGATVETVADLLTIADGVIVGTGIKPGRDASQPIDPDVARAFARAAGRR